MEESFGRALLEEQLESLFNKALTLARQSGAPRPAAALIMWEEDGMAGVRKIGVQPWGGAVEALREQWSSLSAEAIAQAERAPEGEMPLVVVAEYGRAQQAERVSYYPITDPA